MNKQDRERLWRFNNLLGAVPLPHDGTGAKSASIDGFVGYATDMKAISGSLQQTLQGIAAWGIDGLDVGYDYEDPDLLMDALEDWLKKRQAEGWESASGHSFAPFREQYRDAVLEKHPDS